MGCGASRVRPDPALVEAALRFGQQFELTTPMLVMPFGVFKAQGRIGPDFSDLSCCGPGSHRWIL